MLYKGDTLYLDWLEDGIAELVFDAPGSVNKLDTANRSQPRSRAGRTGKTKRSQRPAAAL